VIFNLVVMSKEGRTCLVVIFVIVFSIALALELRYRKKMSNNFDLPNASKESPKK
jgi:hypothetical protein